jgi:hypothetical protein
VDDPVFAGRTATSGSRDCSRARVESKEIIMPIKSTLAGGHALRLGSLAAIM